VPSARCTIDGSDYLELHNSKNGVSIANLVPLPSCESVGLTSVSAKMIVTQRDLFGCKGNRALAYSR